MIESRKKDFKIKKFIFLGNVHVSTTEVALDEPINVEKSGDVVNEEKHTTERKHR